MTTPATTSSLLQSRSQSSTLGPPASSPSSASSVSSSGVTLETLMALLTRNNVVNLIRGVPTDDPKIPVTLYSNKGHNNNDTLNAFIDRQNKSNKELKTKLDSIENVKIIVDEHSARIVELEADNVENKLTIARLQAENAKLTDNINKMKTSVPNVLVHDSAEISISDDHDILELSYAFAASKNTRRKIVSRDFRLFDEDAFSSHARSCLSTLSAFDFDLLACNHSPSPSTIDFFISDVQRSLLNFLDAYAPLKSFEVTRQAVPWFTSELKARSRKVKLLYKRAKRSNCLLRFEIYRDFRNALTVNMRRIRSEYTYNRLVNIQDPNVLWRQLAGLRLAKFSLSSPLNFFSPDQLNQYYVFISRSSPPCSMDDFNKILDTIHHTGPLFNFHYITECEVLQLISKTITLSRSPGPDKLSSFIIRIIAPWFVKVVVSLLNTCVSYFPSNWKHAHIRPLLKIKTPLTPADTCPIARLPELSKLFERLAHKQIMQFLDENNLLNSYQSGYRKSHSTQTALLRLCHNIRCAADKRHITILVLFDFSKAFDTVSHTILLSKLAKKDFSESSLKWMYSYLSHRSQTVVDGLSSFTCFQTSFGVAQSSVLGPLLFSAFIDDIGASLKFSKHMAFADDTQIYLSCLPSDLHLELTMIRHDVSVIADYALSNSLKLNLDKSKVLILGHNGLIHGIDLNVLSPVVVDYVILPYVNKVRNLGVVFKSNFSWASHVISLSKSSFYTP
ncbi:uncharacterized protein LOC118645784 [Monomorium pharaonis]|uniref:uncharacterized protein LOC118645784 n=1 Tax=Monomorium pharaonis TaxID=307658 RepID=UPI001745D77C|nr:uncharacterized protein LOC118645784 [Monomorium pharaonis]